MKTLLVQRHAKSSWGDPGLADHDRPLNDRGRRDAPRMGRLLRSEGFELDALLSSTALRARTTASEMVEAGGYAVQVELRRELYLAPAEIYIELLREQPTQYQCVMVVGHNPGVHNLVMLLTQSDGSFPTAALAHVELPIVHWEDLTIDTNARLVQLWRPKELQE